MGRTVSKCLVSVIIPAYNEKSRIKNAVFITKNVLEDSKIDGEIVVAEDGSNDGTRELAIKLQA